MSFWFAEASGAKTIPSRALQCLVLALLFSWLGLSLWLGLDIHNFDDLVRTVLAKAWVQDPFFFTEDVYWLPLPFLARGGGAWVLDLIGLGSTAADLLILRLVSIAYLWGTWRLLSASMGLAGAGPFALALFTLAFTMNFGTLEFAGSALSEPDFLFWISLVLWILIRGESGQSMGPLRTGGLGVALMLACMTRYEAWGLTVAVAAALAFRNRRRPGPFWRWWGLALPAVPIAAWVIFSYLRFEDPIHFLRLGEGYVDSPSLARLVTRSAIGFFKLNPILTPLLLVFGIGELVRRRRDRSMFWIALLAGVVGAWALYKLWSIETITRHETRYAWDVTVLLATAGAMGLERAARRLDPQAVRAAAAGLIGLSIMLLGWQLKVEEPYLPPDLRRFCRSVDGVATGGKILLRDCSAPESEFELQVFRALVDLPKLVLCDWIEACDSLDSSKISDHGLSMLVTRVPTEEPALYSSPIITSELGWTAWRIRPNG